MMNTLAILPSTLTLALLLGATAVAGQDDPAAGPSLQNKKITSVRVDEAPRVDGRLDDSSWSAAAQVDDFHQISPQAYGEPSQRTEVRLAHDSDHLYIAAHLFDDQPQRIAARQLIQGADIRSDDRFFVILDTFDDQRNAFFFSLNGNGVRREALISGPSFNDDWDAIWEGAARVGEEGIVLEMAIPFKSLAFDPGSSAWGINFGRIIPRTNEEIYWSSQGRQDFPDSPAFAGRLEGLTGLQQGLGLDVVPAATATLRDRRDGTSSDFEPSLDVFYRPSAALTAAVTLNTDFSATEADTRQINTDRFSLFFPEKRDFFLQDAGIFDFGGLGDNGRPFFSRRMGLDEAGRPVAIRWGAKLTGRQGRFNYGLLNIEQEGEAGGATENLVVGRVSMNVLEESSIGAIVTHGDPDPAGDNTLVGTDLRYRTSRIFGDKVLEARAWAQQTSNRGVDGEDAAYGARLRYPNDRWFMDVSFTEIQKNFDPALGFVNRAGIRQLRPKVRYRYRPQGGRLRSIDSWIYYERLTDTDNRLQTSRLFIWGNVEAQTGDELTYQYLRRKEVVSAPFRLFGALTVPAGEFTWGEGRLFFETATHRRLSFNGNLMAGGFYDGDRMQCRLEAQWRPSKHAFLSTRYEIGDYRLPAGRFITRQATLRLDFAFTAAWSWSNLVQFDNVSDAVGLNSRLRWIPRAGRELFLVVNQGWDVELDNHLRTGESQVTSKVGYTFRF